MSLIMHQTRTIRHARPLHGKKQADSPVPRINRNTITALLRDDPRYSRATTRMHVRLRVRHQSPCYLSYHARRRPTNPHYLAHWYISLKSSNGFNLDICRTGPRRTPKASVQSKRPNDMPSPDASNRSTRGALGRRNQTHQRTPEHLVAQGLGRSANSLSLSSGALQLTSFPLAPVRPREKPSRGHLQDAPPRPKRLLPRIQVQVQ